MKRKGCADGCREVGSTFWLAIPQRSTGRHEGMGRTVEDAFPSFNSVECCEGEQKLVVMGREEVGKQEGVGRADEGGYTIFEIQWA
ncbi:hypothetical protein ID866_10424 [Astraeus odoratus]|nr:hypothetical protein ID866_10424 [Astraeus odoratus]